MAIYADMKVGWFIIFVCLSTYHIRAQERPAPDIDLQRFTDDMVGFQDDDGSYEDLYENYVQILSSPYDVNTVSAEELRFLNILTDQQIQSLLDYRKEQGKLLDIYELQVISGFDLAIIRKILPYVRVENPLDRVDRSLLKRIFSADHSYLVARYERTLERKKGFVHSGGQPSAFLGSPGKIYFRVRSALPGDFSVGLTGEKDAGEKIVFAPSAQQLGMDFTSWHLQLQNKGKLKNLIAGDFQAQFGQGLLLGGAFGLGKGGESVATTRKSNLGFVPYTSLNEASYQRGTAFTLQPSDVIRISAFYSRARRDASGDEDTISSFQATGYHRTAREVSTRKKVMEQSYGLVLQFVKGKLDAGLVLHVLDFDTPVRRKPTLYNQYAFNGPQNINGGLFINYRFQNVSFFSEVGQSWRGGRAGVAGLLISAHPRFDLAIICRNYMRNFHSLYSNAFSENTQPKNERGVYWGWKYRLSRQYSFRGYLDLFTFPWLGFRRYAPSSGFEWLMRADYQPARNVLLFLQVREERKARNVAHPETVYQLADGDKRNLTVNCEYGIGEKLKLKSRVQYNAYHFDTETTEGFAVMQDVSLAAGRFRFTGRHALFATDNYDNRHYAYENDAWLAYSLPAYSGTGVRNYALIEYKAHKRLTVWLRYARTRLVDTEEIGSGEDLIAGNTRNDVKFQARFRF
jgi:hypothetical protein